MHRVVITGMGVISPIGSTLEEFWANVVAGKSGIGPVTRFDTSLFRTQIAAEVKHFEPERYVDPKDARRLARHILYALAASRMAMEDADLKPGDYDPNRAGVVIGSGIGGIEIIEEQHQILLEKGPRRVSPFFVPYEIINMAAGRVSIDFDLRGPNLATVTACASSNHAIGDAFYLLQRGEADLMLAGGSEAAITPLAFAGFCSMKAMSTRERRSNDGQSAL